MSLAAGTRLDSFEIVAPLGAGGMGEVYRARDIRLGRYVAVKVLPPAFSLDPDRLRRFQQEAEAAAALNHPSIVAIFDIGTNEDGAPYIVSELLEGYTLRHYVRGSRLPLHKVIDYGAQIARGLAAAHEQPFFPDTKLPPQRLSQLDSLYCNVSNAIDNLVQAVGLKAA